MQKSGCALMRSHNSTTCVCRPSAHAMPQRSRGGMRFFIITPWASPTTATARGARRSACVSRCDHRVTSAAAHPWLGAVAGWRRMGRAHVRTGASTWPLGDLSAESELSPASTACLRLSKSTGAIARGSQHAFGGEAKQRADTTSPQNERRLCIAQLTTFHFLYLCLPHCRCTTSTITGVGVVRRAAGERLALAHKINPPQTVACATRDPMQGSTGSSGSRKGYIRHAARASLLTSRPSAPCRGRRRS